MKNYDWLTASLIIVCFVFCICLILLAKTDQTEKLINCQNQLNYLKNNSNNFFIINN